MNHQFLSKKRCRYKTKTRKTKSNHSQNKSKLMTKNKENHHINRLYVFRKNKLKTNYHLPVPAKIKPSVNLFLKLTHFEMKKAIFSFLTQKEINTIISSIYSQKMESLLLKSSCQIIKEHLLFQSNETISLYRSIQLTNSNNYNDSLFNNFPSVIHLKNSKYFIQHADIEFYLDINSLYYYKGKTFINHFEFSKEFITHIQFINSDTNLIAVFCFNTIKLFNFQTNTITSELPYSGNSLIYNPNVDIFVITSDLSGIIFFHSHNRDHIIFELKLFTNGIDIIELNSSINKRSKTLNKIIAYSSEDQDSNDIYIIDLETFGKSVLNHFNRNKLLLVSTMVNYMENWLISADREEVIAWNLNTKVSEMRIKLNMISIIRVNYLPMIRPDCFAVFAWNEKEKQITGKLMYIEAKIEERFFPFCEIQMENEENIAIYSISQYTQEGIQLTLFFFERNQSLECNKINKYNYIIPDKFKSNQ